MKTLPFAALLLFGSFACGGVVTSSGGGQASSSSGSTSSGASSQESTSSSSSSGYTGPTPARFTSTVGCGDFEVALAGIGEVLVVSGDTNALQLLKNGDSVTVELGPSSPIRVRFDQYDGNGGESYYCTDRFIEVPRKVGEEPAVSGRITVTRETVDLMGHTYSLRIDLSSFVVAGSNGSLRSEPPVENVHAQVGWYPR